MGQQQVASFCSPPKISVSCGPAPATTKLTPQQAGISVEAWSSD